MAAGSLFGSSGLGRNGAVIEKQHGEDMAEIVDGLEALRSVMSLREIASFIERTARWVAPETFGVLPLWLVCCCTPLAQQRARELGKALSDLSQSRKFCPRQWPHSEIAQWIRKWINWKVRKCPDRTNQFDQICSSQWNGGEAH